MPKYVQPEMGKWEMTCPFCGTLVRQHWRKVFVDGTDGPELNEAARWCRCGACEQTSWWVDGDAVAPHLSLAPAPQDDMPSAVKALYDEARTVAGFSPRSAAALLRTALEVLVQEHLGQGGVGLNDAIGNLVKAGRLDEELQQAMDLLRLTGNGAVHPREIRLDDTQPGAGAMFELLNLVVDRLVARPLKIERLYEQLPQSKKDQIGKRDRPEAQ